MPLVLPERDLPLNYSNDHPARVACTAVCLVGTTAFLIFSAMHCKAQDHCSVDFRAFIVGATGTGLLAVCAIGAVAASCFGNKKGETVPIVA